MKSNYVIIEKQNVFDYPTDAPFRPSNIYPETPITELSEDENRVYPMVRNALRMLGTDDEHYGTKDWNPLRYIISQGDTVLIKPNLVMDVNGSGKGTDCLYTNPSVVAAVLDYVCIALNGEGTIIIGDAPMQECNFERLIKESGYEKLVAFCAENYKGIEVKLVDFRDLKSNKVNNIHMYDVKESSDGIVVNLGDESEFAGEDDYSLKNLRITNYDSDILKRHHNRDKHEYCINKHVLAADVVINMPKPKTHRKAGVTIALKNLVGINARKEYLPHHTDGSVEEGGDEYLNKSFLKRYKSRFYDYKNRAAQTKENRVAANFWMFLIKIISKIGSYVDKDGYFEGSWYGNHTISKTIADLNKIVFYADKMGVMNDKIQRKYLIIADMVVSGEKDGPVNPDPKKVGIIAIGENPICFDSAVATLMGADIDKIPTLKQIVNMKSMYRLCDSFALDNIRIVSNSEHYNKMLADIKQADWLHYIPIPEWREVFKRE